MKREELVDILLVEDNSDDTELTTHALSVCDRSIRLLRLRDGVEALDFIFAKNDFKDRKSLNDLKLILMDLKLPRIDGLEVLRKIREDDRTRALPVVILTSSREKRDIKEAYRLGVNSYVVKPVGFDSYVRTVSALAAYWNEINECSVPDFG